MFFSDSISITRSGGGVYDSSGIYQPNMGSTLTVDANVQPLRGKELMLLPEGSREKESLKILTYVELMQVIEATGQEADVITWQGRQFKIHSVGYFGHLIPHYESIAIRINNPVAD